MSGQENKSCVAGVKQTRKAIINETAGRVLLAENADPALTEPLAALAEAKEIPVQWLPSMKELGHICKLSVGAAAAAELR